MVMPFQKILIIGYDKQAHALFHTVQASCFKVDLMDTETVAPETLLRSAELADLIILTTSTDYAQASLELIRPVVNHVTIISDTLKSKTTSFDRLLDHVMMKARYLPFSLFDHGDKHSAILCPSEQTDLKVIEKLSAFLESLSYQIEIMSADQHDQMLSYIYQVPELISCALFDALLDIDDEARTDILRLCQSKTGLYTDELTDMDVNSAASVLDNNAHLADALEGVIGKLTALRKSIRRGDYSYVEEVLSGAQKTFKAMKNYR